jgi:uncharacterized protein YndB with AHSA1/START domain
MNNASIHWPTKFAPAVSPVFVSNSIDIDASPEKVWHWLTNAAAWSDWYVNASHMRILSPPGNHLQAGSIFKWKTFGVHLQSNVLEFVPQQRLAWDAKGIGIMAYHAWLIIPTPGGCRVLTEETQHGWLCRLSKAMMPGRMYKYHQIWLEGLKKKAEEAS